MKFDGVVGVFLSKEVCKKSSVVKTSGSALSVERKERLMNRGKKKE